MAEEEVTGVIDWSRRFDHMQQHTGQHLLSAVLIELFDAPTVSFHLGAENQHHRYLASAGTESDPRRPERRANQIRFREPAGVLVSFEDSSQDLGLRKATDREGVSTDRHDPGSGSKRVWRNARSRHGGDWPDSNPQAGANPRNPAARICVRPAGGGSRSGRLRRAVRRCSGPFSAGLDETPGTWLRRTLEKLQESEKGAAASGYRIGAGQGDRELHAATAARPGRTAARSQQRVPTHFR